MSQVCIVCAHLLNWDSINTRIVCEIRQDSDFEQCGSMYTREAKAVLPIQASCVHSRGKSCAPNTSKLCTLTREKLCFQYKQAVYTHEGKAVLPILLQYTNQGRATTGLCLLHVRPSSRHSSQLLACIHTCFCCLANKC